MAIADLDRFKELEEACGNRYFAIKFIAKASRKLGNAHPCGLPESQLITWVITGQCPYTESQLSFRQYRSQIIDDLEDALGFILDDEVADEVRNLYKQSIKKKRLQVCNRTELGKGRIDRVNILLRMVWYSSDT